MSSITEEQRELVALTQSNFPLVSDPYTELGKQMGESAEDTYQLMKSLRNDGFVRRLGPAFDSYKLGYVSTLCAVAVPGDKVEEVAEFINTFMNVTHNYLRENKYNIWFTVIAHGDEELQRIVQLIEENAQSKVLQLPALRLFKIKVDFNIKRETRKQEKRKVTIPKKVVPTELSADDREIVRVAMLSKFDARRPFKEIAEEVSQGLSKTISEQHVIDTLKGWKNNGTIRRFGLTLRHRQAGFNFNVMGVWDVKDEDVEKAGSIMALQDEVSHCYERPRVGDWQSNLYTMIHGQTREECDEIIATIKSALEAEDIEVKQPQMLFTLRELKKKSMKYFNER